MALGKAGALIQELHTTEARQHISHLSLLIDELLAAQALSYKDLSAVAVSNGPGSYTGLRVGYATAKGLCLALDIPLIEVDTLYSIAWGMKHQDGVSADVYIPMIDARRMEVYSAQYDSSLVETQAASPWILDKASIEALVEQYDSIAFGGNGAFKIRKLALEVVEHKKMIVSNIECNASFLIAAAWQKYEAGVLADLAYCEPRYLKPPNITKPKKVF